MIGDFFSGAVSAFGDSMTGGMFSKATDFLGINTGTGGGPFDAGALGEVAGLTHGERMKHSATSHRDNMEYKDQELKQETESTLYDMGAKELMGTLNIMDGNIDNNFN